MDPSRQPVNPGSGRPAPSVADNPFLSLLGARRGEWREGYCEFHLEVRPELLNRQGVLQGGVLSTLLDVACGYAGLYVEGGAEPVHGHTVSLTTNFVSKGDRGLLVAKGFLVQRTRTLFFARGEAWLEGRSLLATAQGCFKLAARPR
ncbi:MAG: PaaI family thioesterase [Comamonadaceae bacterium]|nr:MAG: PaaI family thioesterase [Comamonadaceae bacterium]